MNDNNEMITVPPEEIEDQSPSDDSLNEDVSALLGDEEITEQKLNQIGRMIRSVGQNLRVVQEVWESTKNEFNLTDPIMRAVYTWNVNNRDELPTTATDEEKEQYDRFNGIDKITEEEIEKIFGKDHCIIGVDHSQTVDRIKSCTKEFIGWLSCLQEYREITRAYAFLQNEYDERNMDELQKACDAETNSEEKEKQQKAIDMYRSHKYLGFLKEPQDEKDINRIVKIFSDGKRIEYMIKRATDKLKQMHISRMFILEISQFEKRYLDEKYHHLSNILLLYFAQLIVYCDCHDTKSVRRSKVVFMFNAMDSYVRKSLSPDKMELVKENLCALLDNFIDLIPKPETPAEESST